MKSTRKGIYLKKIKTILEKKSNKELINLITDLYTLNKDNTNFINARVVVSDNSLAPYKKIIEDSLYPDICNHGTISLSKGRKAISDYKKAVGDLNGTLELMVFYVECGNQFTIDYGDIDEEFYSSLESMFDKILNLLRKSDDSVINKFLPRLISIRDKSSGIGWGYHDYLCDAIAEMFPEKGD